MALLRKSAKAGRNRTRVPSAAQPPVQTYAYHAVRPDQPPTKSFRRKRVISKGLRRLATGCLLVLAAAGLVIMLNLTPSAKVETLGSANQLYIRSMDEYQNAANTLFKSSMRNHNKLTVDAHGVEAALERQFPELDHVNVTLPLLSSRPVVHVATAKPSLLLITNNGSYVIDSRGKTLFTSNSISSVTKLNLPQVIDQSGLQVWLNQQILTEQNVSFIRAVAGELQARHYGVASMVLPVHSSELDVHPVGQSYFVKFNMQNSDPHLEAGTFLAAINQLHKQNITPKQYVDVRVSGRAYYK